MMPQPPSPPLLAVPAHIVLDQHAEGSGSCAEGGDGVSGESLEKQEVILLKMKV